MLKHRSAGRTRTLVTRLRGNRTALVTIALVMSLLAGGAALARRGGPATESKGSQVTPASLTPSTPSKEYIYAGGRLIATEEPAGSTCSYSILPTSQSFAASGGPGNVTVTVAAGCPWTATSNAAWITINSGTPGNGNGSVGFTVTANSGGARNGTMTIAGQTFTVSQDAALGCSYSILPTSQSFAASGGPGNVTVTVAAGCPWTATSNAAWITINSGTPGNGNGSVGFTVAANSGGARNGTMTIAGQTFTVSQDAASGCSYSILPTSQSFAASGGPGNVTVTVAAGCPWTATSNAAWITINSGTPGNGNGSVGFTVAANSGGARNGTMTIAGQTFTVSQDAAGGGGTAPSLSGLSPVTAIQGASFTLTINGSNLAGATSVNFSPPDDVTITNINSTASQVTCSVSIGAAAATGGRLVTVTTASGGTSTNFLAFGINSSSQAPTISSISPSKKARGTTFTLTINGTNLSQTSSVNFNSPAGITVSNIVVVSAGQVTATVSISSGAATGIRQVSVTALGVDSNTKPFTVQ